MKCTRCGAYIPDGELYCSECGCEVQIVPDYNPLDDVLTKEVKGSIDSYTRPMRTNDINNRSENTGRRRAVTGNMRRERERDRERELAEEKRRQQIARKKAMKQKKKKRRIIFACLLVLFVIAAFVFYKNSYVGVVKSGEKALNAGNYTEAENKFTQAIHKNKKRPEAYTGLANVYKAQDELDAAEAVFLNVLKDQNSNADLYEATVKFYLDTDQAAKIPDLLDESSSSVKKALSEYIIEVPEFSLEEGSFDEVQQVSLSSEEDQIYYTTDGSQPSTSSTKYTEPILLNEGENTVKAISVNKKEIPSLTVTKTYNIDIPVADAPAVTPSTGQYEQAMKITIQVPDGYTAYYTTDGTTPSESSNTYLEPFDMPEGKTVLQVVLINGQGKMSQITTRSYELDLGGYEEE